MTFLNYFFIYIYLFIHLSLVDILFHHCCTLVFLYSTEMNKNKTKRQNKPIENKINLRKRSRAESWLAEQGGWDGEKTGGRGRVRKRGEEGSVWLGMGCVWSSALLQITSWNICSAFHLLVLSHPAPDLLLSHIYPSDICHNIRQKWSRCS